MNSDVQMCRCPAVCEETSYKAQISASALSKFYAEEKTKRLPPGKVLPIWMFYLVIKSANNIDVFKYMQSYFVFKSANNMDAFKTKLSAE